jgi:hypothetical protein
MQSHSEALAGIVELLHNDYLQLSPAEREKARKA